MSILDLSKVASWYGNPIDVSTADPRWEGNLDGDGSIWESDVLPKLASDGQLAAYQHEGFWQPMDTAWERDLLEEQWGSGAAPWKVW